MLVLKFSCLSRRTVGGERYKRSVSVTYDSRPSFVVGAVLKVQVGAFFIMVCAPVAVGNAGRNAGNPVQGSVCSEAIVDPLSWGCFQGLQVRSVHSGNGAARKYGVSR